MQLLRLANVPFLLWKSRFHVPIGKAGFMLQISAQGRAPAYCDCARQIPKRHFLGIGTVKPRYNVVIITTYTIKQNPHNFFAKSLLSRMHPAIFTLSTMNTWLSTCGLHSPEVGTHRKCLSMEWPSTSDLTSEEVFIYSYSKGTLVHKPDS